MKTYSFDASPLDAEAAREIQKTMGRFARNIMDWEAHVIDRQLAKLLSPRENKLVCWAASKSGLSRWFARSAAKFYLKKIKEIEIVYRGSFPSQSVELWQHGKKVKTVLKPHQ